MFGILSGIRSARNSLRNALREDALRKPEDGVTSGAEPNPAPEVAGDDGDGRGDAAGIQLPPPVLRYKVAGTEDGDWFVESGRRSLGDLDRALASVQKSYDDFDAVLDWGCGCGRILRHLPVPVLPRKLYGNEIDAEAIEWVSANMPWVETSLTEGKPPLPYSDGSFDLIFNHSVMSHLDEDYQDAWLAELARVLRPGGVVTLTVHGQNAFDQYFNAIPAEAPLKKQVADSFYGRGLYYTKDDQWGPDFPDFYHSAFHSTRYVFDHWSKFLRVAQYIPRGALDYQDMVVLRKLE